MAQEDCVFWVLPNADAVFGGKIHAVAGLDIEGFDKLVKLLQRYVGTQESQGVLIAVGVLLFYFKAALCGLSRPVRLVICLGYADPSDPLRPKKRTALQDLVTYLDE